MQEFAKGQTISNLVAVKSSSSGKIRLHLSAGSAAVFADVAGYYSSSSATDVYQPVPQARVYGSGAPALAANADREIEVSGLGGVPVGADAVLINVEVDLSAAGYLRVTPGGTSSSTAVQEFAKGQTISNLVAVKLSSSGKIRLHLSAGSAAVLADVAGYYKH